MSKHSVELSVTERYIRGLLPLNDELNDIIAMCVTQGVPLIRAEVAQLLKVLVSTRQPKKILEIGTGIGYSGLVLLSASTNALLYTIELNAQSVELAKRNFINKGVGDRVVIWQGDARAIVPNTTGEFDMIFMDGAKSAYHELLPYCERLLNKSGLLIADNVLFMGNISGEKQVKDSTLILNMRAFLKKINQKPWLSSVLNVGDGVSVSIKI